MKSLRLDRHRARTGKEPHKYFLQEFNVKKPKSAAQLESLISEFIELKGGICTKVTTSGRRLVNKSKVKDVLGHERTLIEDKWIPGTTEVGTSDLIASIPGYVGAVYIEVKFSKSDRQSERQIKFQKKVESRGFKYIIVKTLDDILPLWG